MENHSIIMSLIKVCSLYHGRSLWLFALVSKRKHSYVTDCNKYIILRVIPYRDREAVETIWKPDDVDLQLQYCLWRHVILPLRSRTVSTCLNAATSDVSVMRRHTFLYVDTPCNEESKELSVRFIMPVEFCRAIIFSCKAPTAISSPHKFLFRDYREFFPEG
jgi:hypothetical protein